MKGEGEDMEVKILSRDKEGRMGKIIRGLTKPRIYEKCEGNTH